DHLPHVETAPKSVCVDCRHATRLAIHTHDGVAELVYDRPAIPLTRHFETSSAVKVDVTEIFAPINDTLDVFLADEVTHGP
ncbi:UNVERIFIED_CONTAM: hypothetical protein NY603_37420, partial [Bacteroidetes bacterium 56_B9]